ncbi:hypothetical protein PF005_g19891 [Phytophthora fragariae]|uniref:Uncharacterized protein n=1 Tax=Phytophthora fragariae TaxID=53985 RepID=A0A6A3DT70_9STRA|nr:hypothetical protein PF003_g31987 [Phytophthora fragariae]KAE8925022.1 hypothetical protein PF009_g24759 [Phytophthora fragariae]KAE8989991.1 hypothetical protein PF011_g18538 [Phytophthora fragariae]KAE9080902.1 hypothetical protein PF010_g22207 [Phytophthora fragariae]KAE9088119.1 hypothetical protein PF007_g20096 [Phytophthora fragariae]
MVATQKHTNALTKKSWLEWTPSLMGRSGTESTARISNKHGSGVTNRTRKTRMLLT